MLLRPILWVLPFLGATLAARDVVPLTAGWEFHLGDVPQASAADFDATTWARVDVPHDWSIGLPKDEKAPSSGGGGFFQTGVGWYRHHFHAPRQWRGQQVAVEFEGVYMNAEVWLNGVSLGRQPYGYSGFRFDLTPQLKPGADNVLAIRVDNSAQPNSRWYTGSGIYRHVRLIATGPVYVAPDGLFVSTKRLTAGEAVLLVRRELRSAHARAQRVAVETRVLDAAGHEVAKQRAELEIPAGGTQSADIELTVAHPRAWSPETPVLYRAVTRVFAGRKVLDEVEVTFGIRTVRVSAERGFELNGRSLKLVGGNVHHDHGPLGAAAYDRAEERRVQLLRRAGFNAVRTSHNPPSPAFLAACDQLGLLVLDEAFDGWASAKNKQDYSVYFKEWWPRDLAAMVRRDRNHPSVVLWSIGNEMYERGNAKGLAFAQQMRACIRELDDTRPVTAGINGPGKDGDWTKFDPLFATLDVAGYNYELARHPADHTRVPERVILVTESYLNETFSVWAAAQDFPYIIGDFVWSALDYLGEAGIGRVFPPGAPIVKHWEGNLFPWHGAACGDIDLIGQRRPSSHYRAIVWDRGEKLYAAVLVPSPDGRPWGVSPWALPPALASWTWPGQEDRELNVEVYSRYERVRLYLNGRLVGEKPTSRNAEFKATFAVPYAAGVLKAVGVQGGREVESFTLETAGVPAKLRLTADRRVVQADGQDLVFVDVEVTDAEGRWVPTADTSVRFTVDGPAMIAGVGNADLTTMETYQANPHRTFQGRAQLILRTGAKPGTISLRAQAEGLPESRLEMRSERAAKPGSR
ncbi:glycoside hydrolase family 2 TIM barrel-domain containing protein [Opitutus sp. ER46]|uniref:glycoside hydrolase family 2 TIM barrel-domain containing protein n=1 Tax=Opitutus sp. ER46 TaxID=2161864 RepID=UPI0013048125|nr:glycoside hydrolase family 2 TIM barrel-domain containing protein [Opitutus sp. ER46]